MTPADCANPYFTADASLFEAEVNEAAAYEYDAAAALILALDSVSDANESSGVSVKTALQQLEFDGASGHFSFEQTLDRGALSVDFALNNLLYHEDAGTLEFRQVRVFHSTHIEFVAPITWIGNVTTPPEDITTATPGHFQNFYPTTRWATGTVAALTMADAAVCIVWTWVYRDTRVVKAAQPIFLALTAVGVLITLAATIPLARNHRDIAPDTSYAEGTKGRYPGLDQSCAAAFWLFCLGFVSVAHCRLDVPAHARDSLSARALPRPCACASTTTRVRFHDGGYRTRCRARCLVCCGASLLAGSRLRLHLCVALARQEHLPPDVWDARAEHAAGRLRLWPHDSRHHHDDVLAGHGTHLLQGQHCVENTVWCHHRKLRRVQCGSDRPVGRSDDTSRASAGCEFVARLFGVVGRLGVAVAPGCCAFPCLEHPRRLLDADTLRNVPSEFNEGRYAAFSLGNTAQVRGLAPRGVAHGATALLVLIRPAHSHACPDVRPRFDADLPHPKRAVHNADGSVGGHLLGDDRHAAADVCAQDAQRALAA
eukprot:6095988-Prymnesium_polylepis.1